MNAAGRIVRENPAPAAADAAAVALACEFPAQAGADDRVWIPAGISHRIRIADPAHRSRMLAAIFEMTPDPELKLVLLGKEVDALGPRERHALRARIAFLPAGGGLLSHLNAWENIVLPLGCHQPEQLRGAPARVHALLGRLGAEPVALLGKLPEEMSLMEIKMTGFVRMLLEAPDLVLVENFGAGLDSAGRMQIPYFAAAYHEGRPGGTFVQIEDVLDA